METQTGDTKMIVIQDGWLKGHCIRRARKAHRCDYTHGVYNGGRCKTIIQPGDFYAEGEGNDSAGGFGNDRYCLSCAGYDATGYLSQSALPLQRVWI
jgi:hypothetical protein